MRKLRLLLPIAAICAAINLTGCVIAPRQTTRVETTMSTVEGIPHSETKSFTEPDGCSIHTVSPAINAGKLELEVNPNGRRLWPLGKFWERMPLPEQPKDTAAN